MDTSTINNKRDLIIDFFNEKEAADNQSFDFDKSKINILKLYNIKTLFIISSTPVNSVYYSQLINAYMESGFDVITTHIDNYFPENLKSLRLTTSEISDAFLKGNCLIISYDRSIAVSLLACFLARNGHDFDNAIKLANDLNPEEKGLFLDVQMVQDFIKSLYDNGEKYTADNFYHFDINVDTIDSVISKMESESSPHIAAGNGEIRDALEIPVSEPEPIDTETTEEDEPPPVQVTPEEPRPEKKVKEKKEKEKKHPETASPTPEESKAPPVPKEPVPTVTGTGPFYTTLKFKLISIISVIVILSLTGMIFLASYFFKSDNEIRVQENNLSISDITASKVKSEIDKSIVLAGTMLNEKTRNAGTQSEIMKYGKSDILFTGIAQKDDRINKITFVNKAYNVELMAKFQVPQNTIESTLTAQDDLFNRAFYGERIIANISQTVETPAFLLCIPYKKDRTQKVTSILAAYIKLDSLLKVFESRGITQSFMVNDKGDVIVHPDSTIVVSGANFASLPIVEKMLKSKLDNGQTRYADSEGIVYLGSFKKIGIGGTGVISTVEVNKAFEEVYNIQRRNLYLMMIILSGAIVIVFFFGNSMTRPIIRLAAATKRIIEGHYHIDIQATSRDEIGILTNSFIEMGRGLEEREKIKSAFGKFVNKELAEAAMRDELKLGGERKDACILFSDIRSFTAISETLEPEEVVEFLNEYMSRMVSCINRTNGIVDKFIGDAIMAVWGTPISKGNDTENAIDSALMMRQELIEYNKDRGGSKKPLIKIGVGLNTGAVLSGQIGSEDRMEYTVIGDTVNLASRIEALNKPFGTDILISEDSFTNVKDIYAVEKMQAIKVKGKEAPQQIYAVLGRLDDPKRPKTMDELRQLMGIELKEIKQLGDDEEEKKYEIIEQ